MKSEHPGVVFETRASTATNGLGRVALVLVVFGVLIHGAVHLGVAPAPAMATTLTEVVLKRQIDASERGVNATTLFIGDSSCLMGIRPSVVESMTGSRCRNLGSVSSLDLAAHGEVAARFVRSNSDTIETVVLLLHPKMLTLRAADDNYSGLFERILASKEPEMDFTRESEVVRWALGARSLRYRVLDRAMPRALEHFWGYRYAFPSGMRRFLDKNGGHAVDPHPGEFPRASTAFPLDPRTESSVRAFRRAIPPHVTLCFGLTPSPDSVVSSTYMHERGAMTRTVAEWLEPVVVLPNIPATFPAPLFATDVHLSERGAIEYSERLAVALKPHLEPRR